MTKKVLGRGLDALINTNTDAYNVKDKILDLKINEIEPNVNQPRKSFDDGSIKELADSIKEHGVIQPIIVKNEGNTYRIIAGERRWRAARVAGLSSVPVIVKDVNDKQLMEMALIENIQREDLNPVEEAEAFSRLIYDHGMTQEELSQAVGKSRPAITNSLRLLKLDDRVKNFLISGELSSGHARTLLALENEMKQYEAAQMIIKEALNVRDTEKLIKKLSSDINEARKKKKLSDTNIESIENELKSIFGTRVQINHNRNKGKIIIDYYSNDELDRLLEIIGKLK